MRQLIDLKMETKASVQLGRCRSELPTYGASTAPTCSNTQPPTSTGNGKETKVNRNLETKTGCNQTKGVDVPTRPAWPVPRKDL